MKVWKANYLAQKTGWIKEAYVSVDENGLITNISNQKSKTTNSPGDYEELCGYTVPALPNAHSHAFQYAMAGLTERLSPGKSHDDFWSWRKKMYALANAITPSHLENIATMVYSEMVRLGFSWVAEFHYLHHDLDGNSYQNPAEMSASLISAAKKSGIGLTLIPIYYNQGGFDLPAEDHQRRFVLKSPDDYFNLVEKIKSFCSSSDRIQLGIGVHSLRAAKITDIRQIFDFFPVKLPKHIHIAEQEKEVIECQAKYKCRPIEYFFSNIQADRSICLVHSTHTTPAELDMIVKSKANVVLCPSTEGNLGDGFFALRDFQKNNGRWCIGTDSHIGLNPFEEIRWLDYGQRLLLKKRNILCSPGGPDSGSQAFAQCVFTGRASLGIESSDYFEVGAPFDAIVIGESSPLLEYNSLENILPTIIYSLDPTAINGTILSGVWQARSGQHVNFNQIKKQFLMTIKELATRL